MEDLNAILRKACEPVYTTPISVLAEVWEHDESAVIGNPPLVNPERVCG